MSAWAHRAVLVSLKGQWENDYRYSLISALGLENRQSWKHDLLGYYLDRLYAEGGPKLEFDDAWLTYRQQPSTDCMRGGGPSAAADYSSICTRPPTASV